MWEGLGVFAEFVFDQRGKGLQRFVCLRAAGADLDAAAGACRQHHQPHDRSTSDRRAVLGDGDDGVKQADRLDKFCGGAGMQAALVDDQEVAGLAGGHKILAHLPLSTRLATLIYFRPASEASASTLSMSLSARMPASLISIGWLTPAMTSILPLSMTEIDRLEGGPPNMSVRMMTPWPSSACLTASTISWRR